MSTAATRVLDAVSVTKQYKKGPRANEDITLSIEAGEVFGLLGPNGAGKTTFLGQVIGTVRPTSGSIRVGGVDVVADPAFARQACAYQPQTAAPIGNLTGRQAIELVGRLRGGRHEEVRRRGEGLLGRLELDMWADKAIPLSGGVARLVAFCMAAVAPGRMVILDEPTNDVDPLRRRLLWKEVRRLAEDGIAVLLVTHNVLEAERCVDRVAILDAGRVQASGTPAMLRAGLGESLRLELVLEPGIESVEPPQFATALSYAGRRVYVEVIDGRVTDAVAWAQDLQRAGRVTEFVIGPTSLEDVYAQHVAATAD